MISLIAHAGAVPFGYTSEMDDCEVQCFSYDDHNITDCETMSWVNTRASTTGLPPLPDLVTSNTPPASPLRRAHSYHFLFPEKPSAASRARRPPTPSAHAPRDTPPTPSRSTPTLSPSRVGGVGSPAREGERLTAGLKHIQEVRQKVRKDPRFLDRRQHDLPQLTWEVPRYRDVQAAQEGKERGERGDKGDGDEEGEERKRGDETEDGETAQQRAWRLVGRDLRKLGDQFALKHAQRVGAKPDNDGYMSFVVPLTFTRCLSASILCLCGGASSTNSADRVYNGVTLKPGWFAYPSLSTCLSLS
ncbi:hypothetical protein C7M84_015118 [Penaeus vannamei]|uniref:Uncharacterized protein n=1 Tax=Penaeus vannamei TaxID=6689 RepID=A0A423SRL1_PENVA|nr:hypothetical protein C7M84_015118 [Penaeus vannamei]